MGDVNIYNEVMMTNIYDCGGKSGALTCNNDLTLVPISSALAFYRFFSQGFFVLFNHLAFVVFSDYEVIDIHFRKHGKS